MLRFVRRSAPYLHPANVSHSEHRLKVCNRLFACAKNREDTGIFSCKQVCCYCTYRRRADSRDLPPVYNCTRRACCRIEQDYHALMGGQSQVMIMREHTDDFRTRRFLLSQIPWH
ncbi:hypothetical protein D3C81_1872270 [compost metagenome]